MTASLEVTKRSRKKTITHKLKSNKFTRNNIEKSNIAIAILEKSVIIIVQEMFPLVQQYILCKPIVNI